MYFVIPLLVDLVLLLTYFNLTALTKQHCQIQCHSIKYFVIPDLDCEISLKPVSDVLMQLVFEGIILSLHNYVSVEGCGGFQRECHDKATARLGFMMLRLAN